MRRLSLLFVAVLLSVSCAEDRPTVAEWQSEWDRVSNGIPSEAEVSSGTRATCDDGLALIQNNRLVLLSTPDPAIDDTVADWLEVARTIYFDCPPPRGFGDSYATLDRLEAEIDLVIAIDQDEQDAE